MDENELQQAVIFSLADDEASEDELCRLLETAGAKCAARFTQNADPDPKTYVGSGKAREIAEFCAHHGITLAVCNEELSPTQIKNLEDIANGVEVIDRSMLILEIFKKHAVSAEGKLQVEIAELRYTVPRLIGKGAQLSRQGGGGGGGGGARRGAGESKLETDRRHVNRRIAYLKGKLEDMERTRGVKRKARDAAGIPVVAVAGYTNAGKSTLLNRLTGAGVLAEDKLFATLDTTTRRYALPDGREILLSDTVGFIRGLPHHLIKAFRSTLDEVAYADVVMLVCDISDENCAAELEVCESLLSDLGAGGKPTVYVFNKSDRTDALPEGLSPAARKNGVRFSALTGEGTEDLNAALLRALSECTREYALAIPLSEAGVLSRLYRDGSVTKADYGEESISVTARLEPAKAAEFSRYLKGTP